MTSKIHNVAVIGAGLMGSAATKYLAQSGLDVLLLGAPEGNQVGIHASHYDEARITRYSNPDRIWSQLAAQSISEYSRIEQTSGIRFHTPCGHLRCDLPPANSRSALEAVREVLSEAPVNATYMGSGECRQRFPYLHFASNAQLHLESGPAGILRPRSLIQAQIEIARQHGAQIVSGVVQEVVKEGDTYQLRTGAGQFEASCVLLATGAYAAIQPLSRHDLHLTVRTETVLLAQVDQNRHAHLWDMPGIIWYFSHREDVPYAYILPPVEYQDGRHYVKIGADHDRDIEARLVTEYDQYMRSTGSESTMMLLHEVLLELIPDLSDAPYRSKPCILTYTPKGYPLIDQLDDGLFIAAGGCGKSAKSSDMIGRLAALLVVGNSWPEPFSRDLFSVS
ncbi:MAG: NAD(P)/FAD-dependent oxidoreductase [Rhodothermales bacterium]